MMIKTLFTCLTCIFFITACATSAEETQDKLSMQALNGSQWYMTAEYYQIADTALPAFTLVLEDDQLKVTGSSGCNHFFGRVALEDDVLLASGPFGMTKKLCHDLANKIEFEFMQALEQGLVYQSGEFYSQSGARFKQKPINNK